jgi:hypothetical protein
MSKIMKQILIRLIIPVFTIGLFGCSHVPTSRTATVNITDLSSAALPAVAAEFITMHETEVPEHDHGDHAPHMDSVTWRFWRDSNRITTERPQLGVGELWQRDGHSALHRKLYHHDRRAIEFQPDDLRMLQTGPSWQKLSLLLDQQVLEQLTAGDIEWSDGYPIKEYQGKIAESEWHIVMRMDLALPVLIERHHEHGAERTELLHAYALSEAPWKPAPADSYDVIDFADLGDKEYDPFVARVLSQMGHDHSH